MQCLLTLLTKFTLFVVVYLSCRQRLFLWSYISHVEAINIQNV